VRAETRREKWAYRVVGIGCFLGALWTFYLAYQDSLLAGADVKTTCKVLSVGRRSHTEESGRSRLEVTISHEVDGKTYERTDTGPYTRDEQATRDATDFRVGSEMPCRYVRGRPELVVVLWQRNGFWSWGGVGVALIVVPIVVGAFIAWHGARKRRSSRRAA